MIKVRITPLLKSCGFKERKTHKGLYEMYDLFEARIYKSNEEIRLIDMWENVYDAKGFFNHRNLILKLFPLDGQDYDEDNYKVFIEYIAYIFGNIRILDNVKYYLGKSEQKSVEDKDTSIWKGEYTWLTGEKHTMLIEQKVKLFTMK